MSFILVNDLTDMLTDTFYQFKHLSNIGYVKYTGSVG
jgi:hypothetical protein